MREIADATIEEPRHRIGDDIELVFRYDSGRTPTTHRWSDFDFAYVPESESTWANITVMVGGIRFDRYPLHRDRLSNMAEWTDPVSMVLRPSRPLYFRDARSKSRSEGMLKRRRALEAPEARPNMLE